MNRIMPHCSEDLLSSLLVDEPTSAEYATAASHVEQCERCRGRLVALAADPQDWKEVSALLHLDGPLAQLQAEEESRLWRRPVDQDSTVRWNETIACQMLQRPAHPEMLGRLGRFDVERLVGSGGMGIVFRGFDSDLNRPVAIKVLAPHLAGSGPARQRFAREARAAAAVVHDNVVAIHGVDSSANPPYLIMQFVHGESLQARINRVGTLTVAEILRIALQTARGLAAAHQQGLVHRDVKPSNILLEESVDRALLTDFGLACTTDDASLTRTGQLPGTPHYMSPEQARGEPIDHRSDLFSLGSVLYTMCTGRTPFRAETSYGILRCITDQQPRAIRDLNPDIPIWLVRLVERLMAKQPEDRYASAPVVIRLLEGCLAHLQQPKSAPLPPELLRPDAWQMFSRGWLPATTVAGALVLVIAVVATRPWWIDRPAAESGSTRGLSEASAGSDPSLETRAPDTTSAGPHSAGSGWQLLDETDQQLDELEDAVEQLDRMTQDFD